MKEYTFVGKVFEPIADINGFDLKPLYTTITIKAESLEQAKRIFSHYGMESIEPDPGREQEY